MLGLPRKLFYAIEAVLTIAYDTNNDPISGKDLCERLGLPPRTLEAMMQMIVRAGILRSVRGPSGGYILAKERRNISLEDICKALVDVEESTISNTALGKHLIPSINAELSAHSLGYLATVTLDSLCNNAASSGVARNNTAIMDFTI